MGNRTVLLVTQLYPPTNAAGALRTGFYSRHLPEFGWNPIVLTTDYVPPTATLDYSMIRGLPSERDIVRVTGTDPVPSTGLAGNARALWTTLFAPEAHGRQAFLARMDQAMIEIVEERRIDAVLVSIGPEAVLRLGNRAHKRWGIPWIADFRDVSEIFHPERLHQRTRLALLKRAENRLTSSAAAVSAATIGFARHLERRMHRDVITIENGFDEDAFHAPTRDRQDLFTLTYTGLIWDPKHRDPRPLFAAFDRLIAEGLVDSNRILIQFFGSEPDVLKDWKSSFRCQDRIQILEKVPYQESLLAQRDSTALIHLSHGDDDSVLTGKVYDYLAARRPMLSIPGNVPVRDLLKRTGAGVSASSTDELVAILSAWYQEWSRTGTVAYTGVTDEVRKYSRRSQSGQLAEILDQITS